jgi:hypothetical protein
MSFNKLHIWEPNGEINTKCIVTCFGIIKREIRVRICLLRGFHGCPSLLAQATYPETLQKLDPQLENSAALMMPT